MLRDDAFNMLAHISEELEKIRLPLTPTDIFIAWKNIMAASRILGQLRQEDPAALDNPIISILNREIERLGDLGGKR